MLRCIYSTIYYILSPWIFLFFVWRYRHHPSHRARCTERLSAYRQPLAPHGLLLHCASLGEVNAALPLIHGLLEQYPELPITISTLTATGAARIQQLKTTRLRHVYAPLDLGIVCRRFLQQLKPQMVILLETEFWPNFLASCQQYHIPVLVANARLSPTTVYWYHRLPSFWRSHLASVRCILAQSAIDKTRFCQLGLDPSMIRLAGNLKYDLIVNEMQRQQIQRWRPLGDKRRIWVIGSTHEPEESSIIWVIQQLRARFDNLLIIWAPRHPHRYMAVAQQCEQAGLQVVRRSETTCPDRADVYLIDCLGELLIFYAIGQCAFIGGSLCPIGGHNLLEPCLFAKPVITGPHLHNCLAIRDHLLAEEALNVVADKEALAACVSHLLTHPEEATAQGQRGANLLAKHRGAVANHLSAIADWLPNNAASSPLD